MVNAGRGATGYPVTSTVTSWTVDQLFKAIY